MTKTLPLVAKLMLELFNTNPLNVASAKEGITVFNGSLNNIKTTPIKYMAQKLPCLPWNMS